MKQEWAPQLLSLVRIVLAIFCFLFLYISAAGPGPWSLDAVLARRCSRTMPVS